jgi:hypothetical protein
MRIDDREERAQTRNKGNASMRGSISNQLDEALIAFKVTLELCDTRRNQDFSDTPPRTIDDEPLSLSLRNALEIFRIAVSDREIRQRQREAP